jgi:recombination protein RecA
LNRFIAQVNKDYGEYTAVKASELVIPKPFTTGSLSVDVITGGFPADRWTEVRGKESAGKSSFMMKAIAANQKLNPDFNVLWVAAENYDTDQAEALGVDNSRVIVVNTQQMEKAFQVMVEGAESKELDMIVLDSYPALVPEDEDTKDMSEFTMASGARTMNKFVRKAGLASKRAPDGSERPFCGIIINQYRDVIGSRYPTSTTPGGHGKDYFYHLILKLQRDEWIEEKIPGIKDASRVGQTIKITTDKNKTAPPGQLTAIEFYFKDAPILGFKRGDYNTALDYFTQAVKFNVIVKKGGWYSFRDERWQGRNSVLASLNEDIGLRDEISELVMSAVGNAPIVTTEDDDDE